MKNQTADFRRNQLLQSRAGATFLGGDLPPKHDKFLFRYPVVMLSSALLGIPGFALKNLLFLQEKYPQSRQKKFDSLQRELNKRVNQSQA